MGDLNNCFVVLVQLFLIFGHSYQESIHKASIPPASRQGINSRILQLKSVKTDSIDFCKKRKPKAARVAYPTRVSVTYNSFPGERLGTRSFGLLPRLCWCDWVIALFWVKNDGKRAFWNLSHQKSHHRVGIGAVTSPSDRLWLAIAKHSNDRIRLRIFQTV